MENIDLAREVWHRLNSELDDLSDVGYDEWDDRAAIRFHRSPTVGWVFRFDPDRVRFRGLEGSDESRQEPGWERRYDEWDVMMRIGEELVNLGQFPEESWPETYAHESEQEER